VTVNNHVILKKKWGGRTDVGVWEGGVV